MKGFMLAAALMVVLPLSACGGDSTPENVPDDLEDRLSYSFVNRDGTTEEQSDCLAGVFMNSGLSKERLESFTKETDSGSSLTAKERTIVDGLGDKLAKCE